MHPLLRSRVILLAYVAQWVVLALWLAILIRTVSELTWSETFALTTPLCLLYAFVCAAPWYVCRALPLGSTSPWRLAINHIGGAILASALWVAAALAVGNAMDLGARLTPAIPVLVVVAQLLYLMSVAFHYVVLALEESREAALQARDAELRALKSQINPHFLFNCLNSISALTASDAARAREMCVRLSEFLRNTLGLGERESISWREELELARTYLEVERVRFGARLQVEMHVEEACSDCRVPALVLQPLVENAIKHGIATLVDGGTIRLESRVEGGRLSVLVENGFDPEAPSPRRHGLGLRNIRNRLETRYRGAARLTTSAEENRFRAELVLPCQKGEIR